MEGGWSLTQTQSKVCIGGITAGVDWHDHTGSVVGSGQRDTEAFGVERVTVTAASKQRKSCTSTSARMWCFECEHEQNSTVTVRVCVCACVCNLRSGDRI